MMPPLDFASPLRLLLKDLDVDASYKTGHTDGGRFVRGVSSQATIDWPRFFVRAAADVHANFSDSTMVRVGAGVRF